MKLLFFKIMLLPVALLAACCNKQKEVKDLIPGTYINHAQSAYSVANDTLVIAPDALTETAFQVTRKTGFCRITAGQLQPKQHQVKAFTGIWNNQKQTLQLTQNGIIILFGAGGLEVQNNKYKKIKSLPQPGEKHRGAGAYENL